MKTAMKDFTALIDLAVKANDQAYVPCDFPIQVNGETWVAHEASICHRDILLSCDKGTATFLVDSYGDRHVCEIFDWESDQDEQGGDQ
jgi:hypothetical protein